MSEELDGSGLATEAISEEQQLRTLDTDEDRELDVPDYVEAEDERSQEQEENRTEEGEKPHDVQIVSEIQMAPSAEPTDGDEEEKQEESKQPAEKEGEENCDFQLREQTEDFLQPEVEPDIPSQVSQLTVTSQLEETTSEPKAEDQDSGRRFTFDKDMDIRRISGDFTVGIVARVPSKASIETYDTQPEASESEESQPEQAEEEEVLDRELYYQIYNALIAELPPIRIRNNFLQKKMVEYFKKRKMEHVFKESDQQIDTQQKYWKRLDALYDLLELDQRRRLVINAELNDLKKERNENLQFVRKAMKELLEREKDISTGLIHTKTGKEIPEKVIERLLKRQWFTVKQVAQLRLKHIKIRNRVAEKQEALQSVDKLGSNLRLVDYEQLKIENRSFADKVEERDEELTKLRIKCDGIFQVLAHLREKSASATIDIIKEEGVLKAVEIEFIEARERTNYFKVERDRYRSLVNKIKEESGILLRSKLLIDMQNAIEEVNTTKKHLKDVKEKQKTQLGELRAIRKNIEIAQNFRTLMEKEKDQYSPSRLAVLCKRRANLKAKWPLPKKLL